MNKMEVNLVMMLETPITAREKMRKTITRRTKKSTRSSGLKKLTRL